MDLLCFHLKNIWEESINPIAASDILGAKIDKYLRFDAKLIHVQKYENTGGIHSLQIKLRQLGKWWVKWSTVNILWEN